MIQRKNILFIDDDRACHSVMRLMLHNVSYNLIDAYSGDEALQAMKQYGRDIDAIISDVLLPDTDGYNIYHMVQALGLTSNISFIFQTGIILSEIDAEYYHDRGVQILYKPYQRIDLLSILPK